jgi:hypothetical protein
VPDGRVQAAIDHWGPRFVQAGVDYNDFLATTARIETWDQWLDEWCKTATVHAALAREAEAEGRGRSAGEAWVRAAVCFHFAKFVWVLDAERSRAAADEAVAALRRAHELLDPTAERIEVPLDGSRLVANLRRPRDVERPPLVILIAGLDSTKEEFFRPEEVFLNRGMATASLDGPGQGEGGYELTIRPDYEVGVAALLDALAGRDDLDLEHVGAFGVSLGGYYAPRAGAFEPRVGGRAAAHARDLRGEIGGAGRGRGPPAGGGPGSGRRDHTAHPAGAVRDGQARPAHPLGADRAPGTRGAERALRHA